MASASNNAKSHFMRTTMYAPDIILGGPSSASPLSDANCVIVVASPLSKRQSDTATKGCGYNLTFYIILPVGIRSRENHVPEARNLSFGLSCPSEMAIVTIKAFRKNLHSKQNARDCRGEKLPGHLRIFDVG